MADVCPSAMAIAPSRACAHGALPPKPSSAISRILRDRSRWGRAWAHPNYSTSSTRAGFHARILGSRQITPCDDCAYWYNCPRVFSKTHGDIAQLGERMTGSHEVRGSNPLISTKNHQGPQGPFSFPRAYVDTCWVHRHTCVGTLSRFDGRSPTARFAVLTTRSLRPCFESVPMHVLAEAYPAAKIPLCVFEGLS